MTEDGKKILKILNDAGNFASLLLSQAQKEARSFPDANDGVNLIVTRTISFIAAGMIYLETFDGDKQAVIMEMAQEISRKMIAVRSKA